MDLLSVFEWKARGASAAMRRRFLRLIANDLNAKLREEGRGDSQEENAERLLERALAMPDEALVRILGAPEMHRQLLESGEAPTSELRLKLEAWLAVELSRLDAAHELGGPAWSALGDLYLPGGPRGSSRVEGGTAIEEWSQDTIFRAPLLLGTLPVDFQSPAVDHRIQASSYRPIGIGPAARLSMSERRATFAKLEEAITNLAAVCPAACDFVFHAARVILPRRDDEHGDFYTSVSLRGCIGLVTLINPHGEKIGPAALMSSLVHEAIHSFLYMRELEEPLVVDPEGASGTLLVSPWTGGRLTIHTYIHACFVWYGLVWLWSQPGVFRIYPDEVVAAQRSRAEQGFARGALEPLLSLRKHVADDIFAQLEVLCARSRG